MEIAFRQIPDHGGCPPWIVDRVFRNLLVDVTGNTHRAEFCIDKLYSPETAGGRQGLVEMRAFEMPPHPRMSLVQQLLIRSLIARFWEHPYESRLARWGTELHDRFMLPHFVRQDFEDVIDELRELGLPLEHEWFEPHFEFRFPCFGRVAYRGVELQLRQAIEPWHVLGEENAPGSTVRYVDSSVERLELKVNGMTDTRHVVTCNGRRVPLHPTGTNGEFVAGVRYRAWQPPSLLAPDHPRPRPPGLRPGRHVDEAFVRRLHLPCLAPGRPRLRHVPGQRLRGGESPHLAVHPLRPHPGPHVGADRRTQP